MNIEWCVVRFVESFVRSCGKVKGQVKEIHNLQICRNGNIYTSGFEDAGDLFLPHFCLPGGAPDGHGAVVPVEGGLPVGEVGQEGENIQPNQLAHFSTI